MISREDLWKLEGKKVKINEDLSRKGTLMYINTDDVILRVERYNVNYNIRIPIKSIKGIKKC